MTIIECAFWMFLAGSGYSYFIYPLLLLPFQNRNRQVFSTLQRESVTPRISCIITAYNEEKNIEKKIINALKSIYPADKLEILVASDGSTDKTNHIVRSYYEKGVRLIEVSDRKGKENAQLQAIGKATGEILVFSDVSTSFETNALTRIAQVFSNTCIGAVSSEDRFLTADGEIAGEGAYVKYEMWLRRLESNAHSLVGLQ